MIDHSTPKQYTCDECGNSVDCKDILMVHLKMHQITEKIKKKKNAASTQPALNGLDCLKVLDCSVDISSEHCYSMKAINKQSESLLDNPDSLNTSDSSSTQEPLTTNSISPVPIPMSMTKSAAKSRTSS